jgi:hypothetical protein
VATKTKDTRNTLPGFESREEKKVSGKKAKTRHQLEVEALKLKRKKK